MQTTQRMIILPQEAIVTINPFLHGHFAEHLGELVYPGVYVGPDSPIPNTGGIRNDVVDALKPLGIPVLRWPGGCFADTYHWQDGVGPVSERPLRVNTHWGMAEEPNHFGTHEFMAFCQAVGAAPYFAANLGSAPPRETRDWVEYCNFAGDSTLANQRRANGSDGPFGIEFWGIGNETWGCGGNMSPQHYAEEFARYRSSVFSYPGTPVQAVACGASDHDWDWTRGFLEQLQSRGRLGLVQALAGHYYCGTAGTATEYTEGQWLELLAKSAAMEGIVTGHRAIMDEFDPERKIKMIYDEWGTWHPVEKGKPGGGLYQQNTIRDACVAALSLDIFHRHADKLFMANIAQLINVLQALLLVEDDKCLKTPTFHVFDLYKAHQGGMSVRVESLSETISDGGAASGHCRRCYRDKQPFALQAVSGSASVKDGMICVTAVNAHPTEAVELDLEVSSARLNSAEVTTLSAGEMHAHNTFDQPDAVGLSAPVQVGGQNGRLRVPMPAGSVIRVLARL